MYIAHGVLGDQVDVPSTLSGLMHVWWRTLRFYTGGVVHPNIPLRSQQDFFAHGLVVWRLALQCINRAYLQRFTSTVYADECSHKRGFQLSILRLQATVERDALCYFFLATFSCVHIQRLSAPQSHPIPSPPPSIHLPRPIHHSPLLESTLPPRMSTYLPKEEAAPAPTQPHPHILRPWTP